MSQERKDSGQRDGMKQAKGSWSEVVDDTVRTELKRLSAQC
jgi:hypothetical protein